MTLTDKIPWLAKASRKQRWLVGVSGGADSVALLHLLVAEGFRNLVVCHLDHDRLIANAHEFSIRAPA